MLSRSHHVCDVCVSLQHLPRGCDAVPEGHLDQRCHADRFLVHVLRGRCCLVAADIRGTTFVCADFEKRKPNQQNQRM